MIGLKGHRSRLHVSGRLGEDLHTLSRSLGGHAVSIEALSLLGQVRLRGICPWLVGHIGSCALVAACRHKPLVDDRAVSEDQRASRRLHHLLLVQAVQATRLGQIQLLMQQVAALQSVQKRSVHACHKGRQAKQNSPART